MKTTIALISICLMIGCDRIDKSEALFYVPDGVTHKTETDTRLHSFTWGNDDEMTSFIVYPHPAGLSQSMVWDTADQIARGLETKLNNLDETQEVAKASSDFSIGRFTGRLIDFLVTGKDGKTFHQCMYVMWDGNRVWQGQMTALKESDLQMVQRILSPIN